MALLIRPLLTGPMVGHTTPIGFRLWGRAKSSAGAVGIARIRRSDNAHFDPAITFEITRIDST